MKTCKLSNLFDVQYGTSLELCYLEKDQNGINFVSRTSKNNGVSAKVKPIIEYEPLPAGSITVAAGGSVLATFLQLQPYYSGFHLFCLIPKVEMSNEEKLYYCSCIEMNKYKYSYGRQANISLPDLQIPTLESIPSFVKQFSMQDYALKLLKKNKFDNRVVQYPANFDLVPLTCLFSVENGLSSSQMLREKIKKNENWIPFIRPSYRQETSIDAYINRQLISVNKQYPAGTLYVSTNGQGSHTFSYVSTTDFVPNSDVSALIPKRNMSLQEKLFYAQCITRNRYKFSYGRKPKGDRLKAIMLPKYPPEYVMKYDLNEVLNKFEDILKQL